MGAKWGQHFLVQESVVNQILEFAQVQENDSILEIGPGRGILTYALLERNANVLAVEIDPILYEKLKARFQSYSSFQILHQDILDSDFEDLLAFAAPRKIVANLPYQISTPLFFKLLPLRLQWTSFTLMLQKEVAERICATPKDKRKYGTLSLASLLGFDAEIVLQVPPSAFNPPPKVDSAIVHLTPKSSNLDFTEELKFLDWSRQLFQQRRKSLINNIRRFAPDWYELDKSWLDARLKQRRPESLDLQEWLELYQRQKTSSSS